MKGWMLPGLPLATIALSAVLAVASRVPGTHAQFTASASIGGTVQAGGSPSDAPLGLTASFHSSEPAVELAWLPADGAEYCNVYRSTESGGPYDMIGSGATEAYTDRGGLVEGLTYYYVVTAVNDAGLVSPDSSDAAVTISPPADEP